MLGRDAEVFLTDEAQARLRRWVSRDAGSLVCFRGPPEAQLSQRLAQMMPVRWTPSHAARFHLKLTADGESMHWLGDPSVSDAKNGNSSSDTSRDSDPLAGMPTLASVAQPSAAQPQAIVWATGQLGDGNAETPVVTALPYGTGRVVVVEGAGMWHWAFLPPGQQQHSQIYGALWGSLTRWLATNTGLLPSQSWLLRSDKTEFTTGESAAGVLLVRESALGKAAPVVELTSDKLPHPETISAIASGDEPGAFRIGFGKLEPGRYTARVVAAPASDPAAQTVFDVRPDIRELLQLDANPALMKRLAEASGGGGTRIGVARGSDAPLGKISGRQPSGTSPLDLGVGSMVGADRDARRMERDVDRAAEFRTGLGRWCSTVNQAILILGSPGVYAWVYEQTRYHPASFTGLTVAQLQPLKGRINGLVREPRRKRLG